MPAFTVDCLRASCALRMVFQFLCTQLHAFAAGRVTSEIILMLCTSRSSMACKYNHLSYLLQGPCLELNTSHPIQQAELLILGSPGSGKSTFLRCIESHCRFTCFQQLLRLYMLTTLLSSSLWVAGRRGHGSLCSTACNETACLALQTSHGQYVQWSYGGKWRGGGSLADQSSF